MGIARAGVLHDGREYSGVCPPFERDDPTVEGRFVDAGLAFQFAHTSVQWRVAVPLPLECDEAAADDRSGQVSQGPAAALRATHGTDCFSVPFSQPLVGFVERLRILFDVCWLQGVSLVSSADVSSSSGTGSSCSCSAPGCELLVPCARNGCRFLAQSIALVLCRILVDRFMGCWELLSDELMVRLHKREVAPLTPYIKGFDHRNKVTPTAAEPLSLSLKVLVFDTLPYFPSH